MKIMLKLTLIFALLIALSGSAFAMPNPASYEMKFLGIKEIYNFGDKIKLTVETITSGEVSDFQFKVLPFPDAKDEGKITNVKTTYNQNKYTYTTTGYFSPNSSGDYTILLQANHKSFEGHKLIEASTIIHVKDPNDLYLNVNPYQATINVGQELPILISYSSKDKITFLYNVPVTELVTKKVDGIYKKVVIFRATEAKDYLITITATKNNKTEVIKSGNIALHVNN